MSNNQKCKNDSERTVKKIGLKGKQVSSLELIQVKLMNSQCIYCTKDIFITNTKLSLHKLCLNCPVSLKLMRLGIANQIIVVESNRRRQIESEIRI